MYRVIFSKTALKQREPIKRAGLERHARELLDIISKNPYQTPPPYEKLSGDLKGLYSRRISYRHRLVYKVLEEERVVHVVSMWTHYEF